MIEWIASSGKSGYNKGIMNNNNEAQSVIIDQILKYGRQILCSEAFRAAWSETHHLKGILADHILNVTIMGCRLCREMNRHKPKVNEGEVILACLCHDLGMTGRETIYKSRLASWREHPQESVRRAKAILPDLDDTVTAAIESHMWPIAGPAPHTPEGRVVLMADKIASGIDWFSFMKREPWEPRIKERLKDVSLHRAHGQ